MEQMEITETKTSCRPSAAIGIPFPAARGVVDVPAEKMKMDWRGEEGKIGELAYRFAPPLPRDCRP